MTQLNVAHDQANGKFIYRLEIDEADLNGVIIMPKVKEKLDMLESTPWLSAKILALSHILREIEKQQADLRMDDEATVADRPSGRQ